jgi:hypothetical protein
MPGFAVAQPADDAEDQTAYAPGAQAAPVPFFGAVADNYENTVTNGQLGAREQMLQDALHARDLQVLQAAGPGAYDEVSRRAEEAANPNPLDPSTMTPDVYSRAAFLDAVEKVRARYPQAMAGIPNDAQVAAQVDARLNAIAQRAGIAGQQHPIGGFLGGAIGSLVDPVNLGVVLSTDGAGAGLTLAQRMLGQSLLWGGAAAVQAPGKALEAGAVGGPAYGLPEATADVLGGLAAGPIFEGGGALIHAALKPVFDRFLAGGASEAESVIRHVMAEDPVARGAAMDVDAGLRDAAAVGPLRNGGDFDAGVYSLRTGGDDLPLPEPNADVGDLFDNPAPTRPELAGVGSQAQLPGATLYDAADYRGRPIYAGRFDPQAVGTDAATFQYKADGDAQGVTARLRGVQTWDPASSGKALVYQDAGGKLTIADGHQRLGLAKRLANQGFKPTLDGLLFRQADGWSPLEVRTIAALKNIREGQGTPLDAAKVFRTHPASLNDDSLPVSGGFIQQAKGLARLSPEAFGAVVNKVIPENYGALIGDLAAARPDLHEGLVRLVHAGEPGNLDEAHALVHEALLDDWVKQQGAQSDLFGDTPAQSLAIGRARLRAYLVRQLRGDARLFGQLVRHADAIEAGGNTLARDANEAALATNQAALEIVAKLGMRAGDVGDAMTEAAAKIADGARVADAGKGVLARVRAMLKRGERLDLGRAADLDPSPASETAQAKADLFDDVGGKGQAGQIAPKPEEAELEAPPAPEAEPASRPAAPAEDDLFGGIAGDEAESAALEHLKACAPGGA